jgi:hypothetical protein
MRKIDDKEKGKKNGSTNRQYRQQQKTKTKNIFYDVRTWQYKPAKMVLFPLSLAWFTPVTK